MAAEQNQGNPLPRFYIVMPMSRPWNLAAIFDFYSHKLEPHPFEIRWLIGQQCAEPDPKGAYKCNEMIGLVPDGAWFSTVADDTLAHPSLLRRIGEIIHSRQDLGAIIFSGVRDGEGEMLHAAPENMFPCKVCGSQVIWNKSFLGATRGDFNSHGSHCDGHLISDMYQAHPEKFLLVDEPLTYFNSLEWWDEEDATPGSDAAHSTAIGSGEPLSPMPGGIPDHSEEANRIRRQNKATRSAREIAQLQTRVSQLEQIVTSAELWQRSWFKRAFHRWHATR